ncbi:hypothetical protein CLCR_09203 [Cladophialophora carrionii]|uniref:Uncharacterized protein n=1 Tax=Cladophialophora carrionii TaxID=86049 RepID=A0A1C1CRF2_9EURO|nr:hypothetical protein CLCR_09203 [Cladophialophora carrionii]
MADMGQTTFTSPRIFKYNLAAAARKEAGREAARRAAEKTAGFSSTSKETCVLNGRSYNGSQRFIAFDFALGRTKTSRRVSMSLHALGKVVSQLDLQTNEVAERGVSSVTSRAGAWKQEVDKVPSQADMNLRHA